MAYGTVIDRKQQRGVGLIEVLITALIIGGSLMALTALQSRSLQFNQIAYMRSQANIVAYDAIDRLRAQNFMGQATGAVADLGGDDLVELAESLPPGSSVTSTCAGRVCTITVTWAEAYGGEGDAETETSFEYVARI